MFHFSSQHLMFQNSHHLLKCFILTFIFRKKYFLQPSCIQHARHRHGSEPHHAWTSFIYLLLLLLLLLFMSHVLFATMLHDMLSLYFVSKKSLLLIVGSKG